MPSAMLSEMSIFGAQDKQARPPAKLAGRGKHESIGIDCLSSDKEGMESGHHQLWG